MNGIRGRNKEIYAEKTRSDLFCRTESDRIPKRRSGFAM